MTSITLRQPKLQMFGAWSALIYCVLFGVGWTMAAGVMIAACCNQTTGTGNT